MNARSHVDVLYEPAAIDNTDGEQVADELHAKDEMSLHESIDKPQPLATISSLPNVLQREGTAPHRLSLRTYRMLQLIASDISCYIVAIFMSFWMAKAIRYVFMPEASAVEIQSTPVNLYVFGLGLIVVCTLSARWGHYSRFRPIWTEILEILKIGAYIASLILVMLFFSKTEFSRLWLTGFIATIVIALPLCRCGTKKIMMKRGYWFRPTFIVGTGENAIHTARALESDPWIGHRVEGFIDLEGVEGNPQELGAPVIHGSPIKLEGEYLGDKACYIFAFESLEQLNRHRTVFNRFIASNAQVTVSPPIRGLPLYGAEVVSVFKHDSVILRLQNNVAKPGGRILKRGFDVVVSACLLVVLFPLLMALYVVIRQDGGPATFSHQRVGRGGKLFDCHKFRSMVCDSESRLMHLLQTDKHAQREWALNQKLKEDPRITRVGRWLRQTSLDELPQLVNVLTGEMSLVGPRPIVPNEREKYGEYLPYYLVMSPGVTGLWQSSGRNNTDYADRVMLDVWYARNWSFWHDMVILIRTVPVLLQRKGAY